MVQQGYLHIIGRFSDKMSWETVRYAYIMVHWVNCTTRLSSFSTISVHLGLLDCTSLIAALTSDLFCLLLLQLLKALPVLQTQLDVLLEFEVRAESFLFFACHPLQTLYSTQCGVQLPNDNVSMSDGHLYYVLLTVYSSPALRRKAATDKLVEKIVKHDSWPIQPDIPNPPLLRLTSRKPLWLDLLPVDIKSRCRHNWKSALVVNSHLVCDPTIRQPGFDLPRQQWSLVNRFRTEQGHCGACRRKWRLCVLCFLGWSC